MGNPEDLWTLILTNPDGNLVEPEKECLHWAIGNIHGNAINSGDLLCSYLAPFPPRGTGFHRYIFVLFKQEGSINLDEYKRPDNCKSLHERSFSTLDFYRKFQDVITPAGLAWFQADWDRSVRDTFHQDLDMKEPVY